jgi:zinc transport system ATP-binding protein
VSAHKKGTEAVMALIECKSVAFGYEGKTVVKDLSFEVNKGDYLCIIGENGSGKSTLMKGLLGLKKQLSGQIIMGDGLRENDIGYLPQQTVIQRDFPASVKEIVRSGFLNKMGFRPFYTKEEKRRAYETMEELGIIELKNRCYSELSGGQQQRVLLARALSATSRLLILDEPVAGLDPVVTQDMYELIAAINKKGITIIMVSHDLQAALNYANTILYVSDEPEYFKSVDEFISSHGNDSGLKYIYNQSL